jgi:hypothetical protein
MAAKTKGGYAVIMGFKTAPFAITGLIGMGGNDCAVHLSTLLTR